MADTPRTMTTESGHPVSNNQNSLTAGPRGPMLMQDFALIEKMAHFNRERVPERVVHAKGYGAHGTFTVTHDISKFTRAKLFAKVGNTCPMLSRFSTVGGEKRLGRHCPGSPRLLPQVLHRGGQLGHGGQQHAHLLHP